MKDKFQRFMAGRYGVDELGKYSLYLTIALLLIGLFVRSRFLNGITFILVLVLYFRMFSKNYAQRRKENEIFFIPCYVRRETCVVAFKAVCRSLAQLFAVVLHGAVGLRQGSAGLVAAERRHFKIFYIIENILILFYLLIG